jgi:hypothetical protein
VGEDRPRRQGHDFPHAPALDVSCVKNSSGPGALYRAGAGSGPKFLLPVLMRAGRPGVLGSIAGPTGAELGPPAPANIITELRPGNGP